MQKLPLWLDLCHLCASPTTQTLLLLVSRVDHVWSFNHNEKVIMVNPKFVFFSFAEKVKRGADYIYKKR